MWIYIWTFLISSGLVYVAERFKNNKLLVYLLLIIAIILPATLAGMRSDIIGTDVRNYAEPMFNAAVLSNNFSDFVSTAIAHNSETAYSILLYFSSRLSNQLFVSLFLTHLLIISSVVFGLWKFKQKYNKNISVFFAMLLFYFVFYNTSLNMIRQSIAMFIIFWAFNFLLKQNYLKYLISLIIAMNFHRTAMFGLLILLIYYFVVVKAWNKNVDVLITKNSSFSISLSVFYSLIPVLVVGILVLMPNLFSAILNFGGFSRYTDLYFVNNTVSFSWGNFALRLPFLIILIMQWRHLKTNDNRLRYFYLTITIIDILLTQLSGRSTYASRIGYYTTVFYLYAVPDEIAAENSILKRYAMYVFIIVCVILYWYYFMVVLGYNETVPYVFNGAF